MARLATAAASSHTSVDLVVFSSSARRSVPSASCGQLINHTQVRMTATVTVHATSGSSRGVARSPTITPAASPVDRLMSARRAESRRPELRFGLEVRGLMASTPD
jgi:hypothetical protein